MHPLVRFVQILWLITESDFITFCIPCTAFGLFGALAGPLLTTNNNPDVKEILGRVPQVLIWNWLNLLVFDIANQRFPDSAVEDTLNKPWRPLPTGLITAIQMRRLLLVTLPIALAINYLLGAWEETVLLFCMDWMYNDLKGMDEDFLVRNLLIALGYGMYHKGSMKVACGSEQTATSQGYSWMAIISGVIFTTMHIQDMKDTAGDRARNRRSAPLVLGDPVVRWTIAIPVLTWSYICPLFLGLGLAGFVLPLGLGLHVTGRILWLRDIKADRKTWKIWAAWLICLYLLPVMKNYSVLSSFIHA